MNKAYIFTVADSENARKPIVWAQSANSNHVKVQGNAEELIRDWCKSNNVWLADDTLEDLAYNMRKVGYAWHLERYCFELSEVNG